MLAIYNKYNNQTIEDWGSVNSDQAKQFYKDFKRRLTLNCKKKGWELVKFSPNHYDFSGFIKRDEKFVYFSYSIPRGEEPLRLNSRSYLSGFLVRTAISSADYIGGYNNFCSLLQFLDTVEYLLDK